MCSRTVASQHNSALVQMYSRTRARTGCVCQVSSPVVELRTVECDMLFYCMTQDMTKLNCLCCLPRVDVVDGHVPSIGMAAFIMGRQQVFGAISQMLTSLDEI